MPRRLKLRSSVEKSLQKIASCMKRNGTARKGIKDEIGPRVGQQRPVKASNYLPAFAGLLCRTPFSQE
jgi:hypothetical protein